MKTAKSLRIDTLNSAVSFQVKKLGFINVQGKLPDIKGAILFDESDLNNSFFDVEVSVAGIDTGNPKRDEHLRGEDFFFVKNHPKIRFKSSRIEKSNQQLKTIGQLTILGVSKTIEIPFKEENGLFEGQLTINRSDFALGKKIPGFVVSKSITINIVCSCV